MVCHLTWMRMKVDRLVSLLVSKYGKVVDSIEDCEKMQRVKDQLGCWQKSVGWNLIEASVR